MKRVIQITLFALTASVVTFISCKKDSISNSPENAQISPEFRPNKDLLSALVLDSNDKAVEFINKKNVEIAEVITQLVTREDFNRFIVQTAKANEGNVYYEQIFKQFPDIVPLFQNTVIGRRRINSLTRNDDQTYDFVRNDIAYQTMIYVPNAAIAQPSDRSIVSPEIQIYRETGEGDIYFAWDVKKDKPKKEINIVEKEAMATTTPVMMTSLRHIAFLKPPRLNSNPVRFVAEVDDHDNNKLQTRCCNNICFTRKANLLFNYDGGTNSELRINAGWIAADGMSAGWARLNKPTFEVSSHGTMCSMIDCNSDNVFMEYNINASIGWQNRHYFFNAYEYDWGSNSKPLGSAALGVGQPIFFEGHRQFTDEWYMFDPQIVQNTSTAVPLSFMFNNIGSPASIVSDPNTSGNSNVCNPPLNASSIKAEILFTRGWQ